MKLTKEKLQQFNKDDLIKIILHLSNSLYNGEYFAERIVNNMLEEKRRARLSPLERASDIANQDLKDFEQEMCNKYGLSTIKECLEKHMLNSGEKWKYLGLIQKHSECLDKELAEMDRQDKERGFIK